MQVSHLVSYDIFRTELSHVVDNVGEDGDDTGPVVEGHQCCRYRHRFCDTSVRSMRDVSRRLPRVVSNVGPQKVDLGRYKIASDNIFVVRALHKIV
ncbi:hypothetical protein DERF_010980 [Dermatophagoides farinae]|uniref:Uncharacterized protein n=1 Tax=Dermatophagoides farinae TaxID=6954 RepID=A0A922HRD3_DERFA|nr:hypothetical protein DERF_010980 [Dermatophagoides farinae]